MKSNAAQTMLALRDGRMRAVSEKALWATQFSEILSEVQAAANAANGVSDVGTDLALSVSSHPVSGSEPAILIELGSTQTLSSRGTGGGIEALLQYHALLSLELQPSGVVSALYWPPYTRWGGEPRGPREYEVLRTVAPSSFSARWCEELVDAFVARAASEDWSGAERAVRIGFRPD